MKRLLISLALLGSLPAFAATDLEVYTATKETQTGFTGAYSDYLSVAVDRSGESGSKDFIVIAYVAVDSDDADTHPLARLYHDTGTATLQDYPALTDAWEFGHAYSAQAEHGVNFQFLQEVSLSNASHTISIELARNTGTGTIYGESAAIIVLEQSAGAQYAELATQYDSGAVNGYVNAHELTFTSVARTVDYLVLYAGPVAAQDESDGSALQTRFIRDDNDDDTPDTTFTTEDEGDAIGSGNDDEWYPIGGVVVDNISASTTVYYKLHIDGDGASDQARVAAGYAIFAMPVDEFENFWDDVDLTAQGFGSTWADSTLSVNPTAVNGCTYLTFFGGEMAAQNANTQGAARIHDGSAHVGTRYPDDRAGTTPDYWVNSLFWADDTYSGSTTIKVQGYASLDGSTNVWDNVWLAVAEVPPCAAAGARRRQNVVH